MAAVSSIDLKFLPNRFNLCPLFERIIRSWGANEIRSVGEVPGAAHDLPVERTVQLSGTLKGTLNVRSSFEFLHWLQNKRSDHFLGRYPADEIMDEMISLFCLYLYHDFWNPEAFHIGPIKPFQSHPQDWPSSPPDSACALLVEGHPVELRLWLETEAHGR